MKLMFLLAAMLVSPVYAQVIEPQSCSLNEPYDMLDFWLGEWDVYVGDNLVGTNTIEKTMKGCAVLEHWQNVEGDRGTGLFYVDGQKRWKQVWVTEIATMPGGVKEKSHQPLPEPNKVRFQGRVYAEDNQSYLDRTTLTDVGNGNVRQLIEVSMDEGATWALVFDAEYRPAGTEQ